MLRAFASRCLIVLLLSLFAPHVVSAATFEVTRADDPPPDSCLAADCSLREALAAAQATPEADTIVLGAGQYFVTRGDLDAFGGIVVAGAGSEATEIIGSGMSSALRVAVQSDLTLRGVRYVSAGGYAIRADNDHSATTLEDVDIPAGEVTAGDAGDVGHVELRIRDSAIGYIAGCIAAEGVCELVDSTAGTFAAVGENVALRMIRSELLGPEAGVLAYGDGDILIEDSTIRTAARPLEFLQLGMVEASDVWIRRTRFIGNGGPLRASRGGMIHMDDVEFRDNIVAGDSLANGDPAVLLADDGAAWRINRALFVGNRGGSSFDGAVVRVVSGANVVMNQVTFEDNSFHDDVGAGFGHTIGVYATEPTIFWLLHATMRRAPSVPAGTPGSLLTVRGAPANVRVFNSVLDGRCAFSGGGTMFQAEGNVEAGSDSCDFDPGSNDVDVPPIQLRLGVLADHGGFTHTCAPAAGSVVLDRAKAIWCRFSPVDQRTYVRPADGVDCDIGAVEMGALPDRLFADGFDG